MPLLLHVRNWALLGLALLLLHSVACGSKGPRYPQDHLRFTRIDAAVEELRSAYAAKNIGEIQNLLLPLDRLERLRQEIRLDFATFEEIDLNFSIDRIMIDGDDIDVFVHWEGQWRRSPTDMGIRERGHGMLRWAGVQSILLRDVEGDLPFGMASRLTFSEPTPALTR